jgi:hypothetical protein
MLWAPTAAFACGGSNPSAVNVYVECLQGGGGAKPTNHPSSGGGGTATTNPTTPVTSEPSSTARVLAHAGPDKALLSKLVGTGLGTSSLKATGNATSPSAIGSAFDLGSGPTALLLILAGTAVVLLAGNGLRFWHRRDRQV